MDLEKLLEMLELDEPSDLEYVESFADIVENDTEIPEETLADLFSQTDPDTVSDLINQYFDDITETAGEDGELCSLLDIIRFSLIALIGDEDGQSLYRFAEELAKFQRWYSFESAVVCSLPDGDEEKILPVRDAITLKRIEKIENEEYVYDYSAALNYEIDDYVLDMASVSRERAEEDEEESGE